MTGNVLEWCWDWYDAYPGGRLIDYRGPAAPSASQGAARCLRGGCCGFEASICRIARRSPDSSYSAGGSYPYGFRVVLP